MGVNGIEEEEAYALLRKIYNSVPEGGFSRQTLVDVFNNCVPSLVVQEYTLAQIRDMIAEWEKKPLVGDEVIYEGKKWVIVNVHEYANCYNAFVYLSRGIEDGTSLWWDSKKIKKTGKNYGELVSIYKELNRDGA